MTNADDSSSFINAAYNPANLTWNVLRTINDQHQYCYCGRDRNLTELTVQCRDCLNWFHSTCVSVPLHPALPFVTNYKFVCRNCNGASNDPAAGVPGEHFERTTAGWKDICATAIANLILEQLIANVGANNTSKDKEVFDSSNAGAMRVWNPGKYHFNKKDHIIPFVDRNWKSLCTDRARTPTWWATLGSCLYITKDVFAAKDERTRSAASDFCLVDPDLWNFRPGHVQTSSNKFSTHVPRPPREKRKSEHYDTPSAMFSPNSIPGTAPPGKRQTRSDRSVLKRLPSSGGSGSSGSPYYTIPSPSPTPSSIFPTSGPHQQEHPFNRGGFKYTPCTHDSLLPVTSYRRSDNPIGGVVLSQADTSPYLYLSENQLTATTEKGFRMVRANVGVREGRWYWECVINRGGEGKISEGPSQGSDGAHVRIGWARREACINAPVGFDAYAYGLRDLTGERIHCSLPTRFGEPFRTGDVIGLYISLPGKRPHVRASDTRRRRIPIKFKGQLWFEEKDYVPTKEMNALSDLHREPIRPPEARPNGNGSTRKHENGSNTRRDVVGGTGWAPPIISGSKIIVYKNGVCQGVAFAGLYDFDDIGGAGDSVDESGNSLVQQREGGPSMWTPGSPTWDDGMLGYYPAVSVFKGGTVTCNFGPKFLFPPPVDPEEDAERIKENGDVHGEDNIEVEGKAKAEPRVKEKLEWTWRPLSERWAENMVEECMWDLVDEVEAWSNKVLGPGTGSVGVAMDVDVTATPGELMEEVEDEADGDADGNGIGGGYGHADVDVGMESDVEEGRRREGSESDKVDEQSQTGSVRRNVESMVMV